jgi:hypothetical protein
METLASVLEGYEEEKCPICRKPLVVTPLPDGQSRFDGCGRGCAPMYVVPENSQLVGVEGAPKAVFRKRWDPNEPEPKMVPKYVNGAW